MSIAATTTIQRPRDEVYAAFCDLERAPERISGISQVELLEGGDRFGVGTRWRETRSMFGKEATEEMTITACDAPASYRAEAASHGAQYVSDLTFEDVGGTATVVTMTFDGRPTTLVGRLMTPIGWLFRGATRKLLQRDLDDMKRALEDDSDRH